MKWDLKSIITLIVIVTLDIIMIALVAAFILGKIPSDDGIFMSFVTLFTNCVTAVTTYYFTHKKDEKEPEVIEDGESK